MPRNYFRLQIAVFSLVSSAFAVLYITQPVLPILQEEFSVDPILASFSVSSVILGITISNLPFGIFVDKVSIRPIILIGGIMVIVGGVICAISDDIWLLIGARFIQGLFLPALTTCIASYLAKTLPVNTLKIVMGSYVSAQVFGGLGGRLLGGWIHPPFHWRYAFISSSVLIAVCVLIALSNIPVSTTKRKKTFDSENYANLLKRWELMRIYLCASGSFFIFSSLFNYLPFRLSSHPFSFSTEIITLLYLVFIVGAVMGPISGRISNRYGSSTTLIGGSVTLIISLLLLLLPFITAIVIGLLGLCAGFFTIHTSAIGLLNSKLAGGEGRANALYVLFYYAGAWIGITTCGFAYTIGNWEAVVYLCLTILLVPLIIGIIESRQMPSS